MRRRGRLVLALLVIALLLFAGRWVATFLADRWWAGQFSPGAAALVTQIHLLQLLLDAAGVVCASAWFVSNLLAVARAVGSVQVPRHVGNLEFRESITPALLLAGAVGTGVVLGLLVGLDSSTYWPDIALAWHGVRYGVAEPLLGHDAGVYVAQLPVWRALHAFALLLVLVATAVVVGLYAVIGAVRMMGGRLAINDHARTHIGWLLAGLAACLGWGYLLEPYEIIAASAVLPTHQRFELLTLVAPALAGTALMVAVLSALWALRPRHALAAAGWVILLIASIVGHRVLPYLGQGAPAPAVSAAVLRRFDDLAFGLTGLQHGRRTTAPATAPQWPSLWDAGGVRRAVAEQADAVTSAGPALITAGGQPRPVWLVVHTTGAVADLLAVADDRVNQAGGPLFYRAADSLAYPTPYPLLDLSAASVRPGAPLHVVGDSIPGMASGSLLRRTVLAWALQAPELLGGADGDTRVAWRLEPTDRLGRLAPFADWAPASPAVVGGRLTWLADGYVSTASFPLTEALQWSRGVASSALTGFLGTVDAETGESHIYLRPGAGALAAAWSEIAAGLVQDSTDIPADVSAAQTYPEEFFRLQSLALERASWGPGMLAARPVALAADPAVPLRAWQADGGGPELLAAYDRGARRIAAVLQGTMRDGHERLQLVQLDSAATAPTPAVVAVRWARFPTFEQIRDSVTAAGSHLEARAVRLWLAPDGLGMSQSFVAVHPGARPVIGWVAVASGDRMGGGRSLAGAWENLRGIGGPLPPGVGVGPLAEAQQWLRRADAALRRGDWAAFGRAFDALRQALDVRADSATQ